MFGLNSKGHQAALLQAYREIFASEQGRRVLADILSTAGAFRASEDIAALAHDNGKRALAFDIVNKASIPEDIINQLMRESFADA
ncbi:Bbp19 family protein [Kiloniella sp. b19]|uniref:Bbp19 family protein n=1 Tax=Kiloniella sp. GXU_MW_B19 TaxID=3141326 RepID=UPI0031DFFE4F